MSKKTTTSTEVAIVDATAPGTGVAVVEAKPLNQTQLKNLQALVDADFKDLSSEIFNEIDQRTSRKIEDIRTKFADQDSLVYKIQDEASAILREYEQKANDAVRKLAEKHKATFVAPINGLALRPNAIILANDRDKQIQRVQSASQRLRAQAAVILGREQRKIARAVLLQGITAQSAVSLIDQLPNVASIMEAVKAETAATNGDDIATLLGE